MRKNSFSKLMLVGLSFAAARLDTASGLYSMGFRWYSAQLGRFIQPDPAGLIGGLNGYAYVGNNPLLAIDPNGLFSFGSFLSDVVNVVVNPVNAIVSYVGGKIGADLLGNAGDLQISGDVSGFITGAIAGYQKGGILGAVATGLSSALLADLGGNAGFALCGTFCGEIGATIGANVGAYLVSNLFCDGDNCNTSNQLFTPQGGNSGSGGEKCDAYCSISLARPGASLYEIIQAQQFANVKASYGIWAYECVTWDDLAQFQAQNKAAQIANALLGSADFNNNINNLRSAPANVRNQALNTLRRPLRPTWAQQGFIGPSGQTDAGQQEELLIANAIVDLVIQRLN